MMTSNLEHKCSICCKPAKVEHLGRADGYSIECEVCGTYMVDGSLFASLKSVMDSIEPWKLSCAIRMRSDKGRSNIYYSKDSLVETIEQTRFPSTPVEVIDNLLLLLSKRNSSYGAKILCSSRTDYSAIGLKDASEMNAITRFAHEQGFIISGSAMQMEITCAGWLRLDEIKRQGIDTNRVFVAMWFDTQMNSAWEKGLKTAIKNCGYDPERVCDRPHNSDICDEIIACIKNAKFVVADFTGNRGGVYYEAGFAHGLGKQVILTCRKDWFEGKTEGKDDEKIHFDLNHHNFIIWDDPDDLAQQLTWRIKATI